MLERILRRGQAAKDFINNEAFADAVREVEADLVREWKLTKAKDSEGREKAYLAVRALNDVVTKLNGYISQAEFARQKAEEARKAEERKAKTHK